MKFSIFSFLFLVLFFGCKKETDLDYDFDANKIVVQGVISVSEGVRLSLAKTFSPKHPVDLDTLLVENARVFLFHNQDTVGELTYISDSKQYYFTSIDSLEIGQYYWLDIHVPNYPPLTSDPVKIIDFPTVQESSFVRVNTEDTISGDIFAELTILLDDPGEVDNLYIFNWTIGGAGFYKKTKVAIKDNNILSCTAHYSNFLLDNCFNGQENVPIILETTYRDSTSVFIEVDGQPLTEVKVPVDSSAFLVQSVDDLGRRFLYSRTNNAFGSSNGQVPAVTVSNISSGYGAFYSESRKTLLMSAPQ